MVGKSSQGDAGEMEPTLLLFTEAQGPRIQYSVRTATLKHRVAQIQLGTNDILSERMVHREGWPYKEDSNAGTAWREQTIRFGLYH